MTVRSDCKRIVETNMSVQSENFGPAWHNRFFSSFEMIAQSRISPTLTADVVGGGIGKAKAHDRENPASRRTLGIAPRNAVMFRPLGYVYVRRS
jgi:hypothetical protein